MQPDLNLVLVLLALVAIAWMAFGQENKLSFSQEELDSELVNRPGGDWNQVGAILDAQDSCDNEIYPKYETNYEVFTSNKFPKWNLWPNFHLSYNWLYRSPYNDSGSCPNSYRFWSSPYYPSRTVLVKPFSMDMARKQELNVKMQEDLKSHK